jgi:hypothetical protein
MSPGPRTRKLTPDQIQRLEKFRRESHEGAPHGYSLPLLRTAMGMRFGFRTLGKALQGLPIAELSYSAIAQWIERYLPAVPAVLDSKQLASGEREDDFNGRPAPDGEEAKNDAEETPGTTRTIRGSR